MSEQNGDEPTLEAPTGETPEAETTTETPEQPEGVQPPWGEDFNPERAWNTITQQRDENRELKQAHRQLEALRNDPAALREFLSELGLEMEDDEPDDEFEGVEDPGARALAIAEALRQERETEKQQAQQDAHAQAVRRVVDDQLEKWGLDEEDGNDILAYAIHALPATKDGIPDIWTAHKRFQDRDKARQKRWVQSKQAPHISPNGSAGEERLNTDGMTPEQKRQARVERAVSRLQAGQG